MATTSRISATKGALVSLVTTAINDANVTVKWGRPPNVIVQGVNAYVGDVRGRSPLSNIKAGRKYRDEEFSVNVVFTAILGDATTQTIEDRLLGYYASLENVIADDPTLGVGLKFAQVGDYTLETDNESGSPESTLTVSVECEARLT